MDETIKQNIMKVVIVVVMFILLLCTITANSKYNKLENEVDGYKYEISSLEETKKEQEKLIESYKKTQKEDRETINKQEEEITNLQNKITTKDATIKQLNNKISELETQATKLSGEITTLQKDLKEKGDTIVFLNNQVNDINNKLTTATNEVSNLTTKNNSLNKKLTEAEEKFDTINKYYVVNSEIELLSALDKGGNIILNTDILMSNNIVISDKYVSIDLNGHNLVILGIDLKSTSLEIKDKATNLGKLSIVGENETAQLGIKVDKNSTLKITNGNYEGKKLLQVAGNLYIVGGNFSNTKEEMIVVEESATLTELGGTFSS